MPQDDTDEAWIKASVTRKRCPSADAYQAQSAGTSKISDDFAHNINNLPPAVLHGIFGHLGPRDLCAVSATCHLWRTLNQDKAARAQWKQFYTSRWRVLGASGEDVCWQTKYGSKMKQGKSWSGKYESDNLWGHKAGVKALKLLPSHGVLLTGSLDRTIRLWDLTYGMPLSISRPHGGTVRAVALDHTLVASGSSDNVVRLWHARHATDGATLLDPAEADAAAAAAEAGRCPPPRISLAAAAAGVGVSGVEPGLAESLMELDGPTDSDDQAATSDQRLSGGLTAAAVAAADASNATTTTTSGGGGGGGGGGGHYPGWLRVGVGVGGCRGPYSVVTGEADEGLFDLSLPGQALRGHIGPVTSLCLTDSCLYSGSWDYTVRVWRRGTWDCVSVLKYPDWVYSVVARGGLLLVASGPEVHVHDLPTGKLVRKFQNLHEGSVSCLEGTHSGRLLFSGGADGLLMCHDLRMKEASRVLWHHNAGVNSMALEDPWLVSAASDGTVIMHNLEASLPNNFSSCLSSSGTSSSASASASSSKRTLGCPGQSGPMYCVDIAESWLAAGGESAAVRTWDFTRAAQVAARAAAARAARGTSKRAAKLRRAAAAAAAGGGTGAATNLGLPAAAAAAGGCGNSGGGGGGGMTGQSSRRSSKARAASNGSSSAAVLAASPTVPPQSAAGGVELSAAGNNTGSGAAAAAASRRPRRGLLAAAAAAAAGGLSSTPPSSTSCSTGVGGSKADRFHKLQSRRSSRSLSCQMTQQQQHDGSSGSGNSTAGVALPAADKATQQQSHVVQHSQKKTANWATGSSSHSSDTHMRDSMLAAAAAAADGAAACSPAKHGSSGYKGHCAYSSSPQGRHWQQQQQQQRRRSSGSGSGSTGMSPGQHVPAWLGGSSPPVSSRLHHSSSSGSNRRHSGSATQQQQQQLSSAGAGNSSRRGIAIPADRRQLSRSKHTGAANMDAAAAGGSSYEGELYMRGASPAHHGIPGSGAAGFNSPQAGFSGGHYGSGPNAAAMAAAAHPAGAAEAAASTAFGSACYGAYQGDCTSSAAAVDGAGRAGGRYHVPFSSSYPSAAAGPGPWLLPGSSPRYEVWGTTLRVSAAAGGDRRLAIVNPADKQAGGGGRARREGDGAAAIVAGSISN